MYRAVVVDDEPFMLEGMRLMIDWEACGFELCGTAANAQEALRLVETMRPNLLITDVRMPGMMGTDLAAIMHAYHPEIALLFFSGYQEFSYAQSAIRAHASGYLLKPIDPDDVHAALHKIRKNLDAKRSTSAERTRIGVLRNHVLRRVAYGDDSREALLRAGVLLHLSHDTPCYCAVFACEQGALPDSAAYLLVTEDAVPFQLTAAIYGLCVTCVERDLDMLGQLRDRVQSSFGFKCALSVGETLRGAEGFALSLRQALDAQGVLFETRQGVRVYSPVDARLAKWLTVVECVSLPETLQNADPKHLEAWLSLARAIIANERPPVFWCRYLACSVDALLRVHVANADLQLGDLSPMRALWRDEPISMERWLDDFETRLRLMHRQLHAQQGDGLPEAVARALDIIRTRYSKPLTIGDLAAELHLNAAYLGQLMRKHTGETFHRLLLDARISHACRALRRTSQTVGEIAYEVGFRDVDYFSRQFRARMGMSPHAYRMQEGDLSASEDR